MQNRTAFDVRSMSNSEDVPQQIAGYNILPLSLPPLPSFSNPATHYLYLAHHQPRIPTSKAPRSLFLVNVPLDSTVVHIKHLFSTQLGLPVGRVEDVQFAGQRKRGSTHQDEGSRSVKTSKKTKKRKRGSQDTDFREVEASELSSVWDRELQVENRTAVVVFVDQVSMGAALKAVKAIRKEGKLPTWGDGMEGKVPDLGFPSIYFLFPMPILQLS